MSNSGQNRRDFIKVIGAAGLGLGFGLTGCTTQNRLISGSMKGAEMAIGHKLREGFAFPEPSRTETTDVVIVGAGVSGLSAARRLMQAGKPNFQILELADKPGGNARSGNFGDTAFPWGAHYLPVPGPELPEIVDMLEEFGAIYDRDETGRPFFEERFLCHAPQERLLLNGSWQAGLIPNNIPQKDKQEFEAFFSWIKKLKYSKGSDGKFAFTLPLHRSSQDERFRRFDRMTMEQLLDEKGWHSPFLRWYVNYCCRDDFGGTISQSSAWAGLFYFCSRRKDAANAGSGDVLTWPEGNAWLTNKMAGAAGNKIKMNALAFSIQQNNNGVRLYYLDLKTHQTVEIQARKAILACPHHVAMRFFPQHKIEKSLPSVPWVTANILLKKSPRGLGAPLSWDNVAYDSPSLGYVHANHQQMNTYKVQKHVLTWYHVLSEDDLLAARRRAAETSYEDWKEFVLKDLRSMHPHIEKDIEKLDLWVWGHGMTRPEPGFLTNEQRLQALKPTGDIHFAHTDLSGISIFEEGFYQGLRAAEEVLESL